MRDIRRAVITLVIGSFSLAALIGIVAMLGSGFGDTQARVIATTTIIGFESIAALCYLSLAGHRLVAVGVLGAAASVAATLCALVLTWSDDSFSGDLWRWFGVSVTIAATFAQASMLIALTRRPSLSPLLWATVGVAGILALILCGIIVGDAGNVGTAKLVGVLAILDVLGTLVLIALGVFGGRVETVAPPAPRAAVARADELALTEAAENRLVRTAAARGITPSQALLEALDALERSQRS